MILRSSGNLVLPVRSNGDRRSVSGSDRRSKYLAALVGVVDRHGAVGAHEKRSTLMKARSWIDARFR
nr:hypothetical protein CFP56_75434 [Quercus suber]